MGLCATSSLQSEVSQHARTWHLILSPLNLRSKIHAGVPLRKVLRYSVLSHFRVSRSGMEELEGRGVGTLVSSSNWKVVTADRDLQHSVMADKENLCDDTITMTMSVVVLRDLFNYDGGSIHLNYDRLSPPYVE